MFEVDETVAIECFTGPFRPTKNIAFGDLFQSKKFIELIQTRIVPESKIAIEMVLCQQNLILGALDQATADRLIK